MHLVDGSWLRVSGAFCLSLFLAAASASDTDGDKEMLCHSEEIGTVPEDVRIMEQELSVQQALKGLDFVQREIIDEMGRERTKAERSQCKYPHCIAGVPWEMLNMAAPNALSVATGTLLKQQALYLRERAINSAKDADKKKFETARQSYCDFIATQVRVD